MTKSRIVASEPITVSVPRAEWAATLKDFTAKNMVRTTTLEVDDPEYGAQAQEHDYPFLGASYDKYDECVELMLGRPIVDRPSSHTLHCRLPTASTSCRTSKGATSRCGLRTGLVKPSCTFTK
jgi:hypothetical protein